jgi:hypothetical protein
MANREQLHAAALQVIDDFTQAGVPYLLYLRKFDVHVLHGPDDEDRELLENHLFDEMSELGVNVISIQEPGDAVASYVGSDIAFARRAPALSLADDQWVEYVRPLIADADLIVSECLMLSEGVRGELEFAYSTGAIDRIALLLPPPGSPFAPVDDEPAVQFVPRAVYAHQLNEASFLSSFVVADLVERLKTIAALPASERLSLARDRARKLRDHPITWSGVAAGYNALAVMQELADESGKETDESWWLRFWWHFRRVTTLTWQMLHAGLPESEASPSLVDGYVKLVTSSSASGPTRRASACCAATSTLPSNARRAPPRSPLATTWRFSSRWSRASAPSSIRSRPRSPRSPTRSSCVRGLSRSSPASPTSCERP